MRRSTVLALAAIASVLAACADDHPTISGAIAVQGRPEGCSATVAGDRLTIVPDAGARCRVTTGVSISAATRNASTGCSAEFVLEYDEQGLHPLDWSAAGGGELPAFRRQGADELVIYYPAIVGGQPVWVKFSAVVKPR